MKLKIKEKEMLLGCIYGPNKNDINFFRDIRKICDEFNGEFIIGGDFNTVLDESEGENSIDRVGVGHCPNILNSKEINKWMREQNVIDPFRLLYPEKVEFSYTSFRRNDNIGKNRLDFYLMSGDLATVLDNVKYEDRLGRDFDHREVTLTFGRKKGCRKEHIYSDTVCNFRAKYAGILAALDIINEHKTTPNELIREKLVTLGNMVLRWVNTKIRLGELDQDGNILTKERGEEMEREIDAYIRDHIDIEQLLEGELTCSNTALYEVLVMGIKNRLIGLQRQLNKEENHYRENLIERRRVIGIVEGTGSVGWKTCNEEILQWDDLDLKRRAGKYREFFMANNERPSKIFCKMGKEKSGDDDTAQIRDDEGKSFVTKEKRGEYIGGYYGKLYKRRLDRLIEIEDYLENNTVLSDKVKGKILTEEEKMSLEGKISVEELEVSLNKSNLSSASGWDGVSYSFIKKYWYVLGPVLCRYANEAVNTGTMGETFRRGLIKLIPKKGEAKKIGDWRPITLLCCGYKIISGVVAARLEKYLYKIIGRGQKGFLKHKNIGSCSINIIDNISQSMTSNEKMGVLCVDFSKAFDSIEHSFIMKVLGFFNFGHRIQNMVGTLLNKRISNVILGENLSPDVHIGRGTPQGDRSSPVLFILCLEILLIKLEGEEGKDFYQCEFNDGIRTEYNLDSSCIEAYADDLTILFKWNLLGLARILRIIKDFDAVSGLQINVGKTQLMITGCMDGQVGRKIYGITVVDRINVLGLQIDRKLEKMNENWEKALLKIRNRINYWNLFKLSIGGRLMIAKTYLTCQATYIMSAIPVNDDILNRMNEVIIQYINGGEKILARDRWFLEKNRGGYGMFDMKTMNMCIKAGWVKRWLNNKFGRDYAEMWCTKGLKTPDIINMANMNTERWRSSGEIMKKWVEYKLQFYKIGRNMLEAKMFFNELYTVEGRIMKVNAFSGTRERANAERLVQFKVSDFMSRDFVTLDKRGMETVLGFGINMVEFFRLRSEVQILKEKVEWRGKFKKTLSAIVFQKIKGSKGFRKGITSQEATEYFEHDIRDLPFISSKKERMEDILDRNILESVFEIWGKGCLDPDMKNFSFRYIQGRLFMNQSRARFDENTDAYCTFCKIVMMKRLKNLNIIDGMAEYEGNMRQVAHETWSHIFWRCPVVLEIVEWVKIKLQIDTLDQNEFMLGKRMENVNKTEWVNIILMWVKYWIYENKCEKKIPKKYEFELGWGDFLKKICQVKRYRLTM